jgi:hypothetical protein
MKACRRDCLHRATVEAYRDERRRWEADRESGRIVSGANVAGIHGAQISAHQLSADEYAAAYPPPLFRDWLEQQAGERAWYDDEKTA